MKYLNTYENYLILEIGKSTVPPYNIENIVDLSGPFETETKNYIFHTDSGIQYSINIMRNMGEFHLHEEHVEECEIIEDEDFYNKLIGISFFTFEGDNIFGTYNDTIITNRGEVFRIMATLKEVITEYLQENPEVKYIFAGGQRGEKENDKEQRENLYLAYFKKEKPNWKIDKIFCDFMGEYYPIIKITD